MGKLNEVNLRLFLREFVVPFLSDFAPSGPVAFQDFEDQQSVLASLPLRSRDGRELTLTISVADSDDGPKALWYVRDVFIAVVSAQWTDGPPLPRGIQKHQFHASTTSALLDRLRRTGVPGFAKVEKSGQLENLVLERWEDYIAYNNFHAERLAARNR